MTEYNSFKTIDEILLLSGVSEKQSKILLDAFENFSDSSKSSSCLSNDIFNLLLACFSRINEFEHEITDIINFLIKQEESLNDFDQGRLMHLKAIKTWKFDNDTYFPKYFLNRSICMLQACKRPEANCYLPRVWDTSGQLLASEGLLLDARIEFQKSLKGREITNDLPGKAITLGNLGRLSMQLGDFESAIKYLQDDINLLISNNFYNKAIHAQLLSTLSVCYIELENKRMATTYNEQSFKINQELENHIGFAFNYLNYINIALLRDDKATAKLYAKNLEDYLNHAKITRYFRENLKAKLLQVKARILFIEGYFEEAFNQFNQALKIFMSEQSISKVETARLLFQFAKLAKRMGNNNLAGQLLRKALRNIDATEEHRLRYAIEEEMKQSHTDSWILHAAGRFIGHEQISFLLEEAGKGKFKGEERNVVILFSDIRGFTSLSETLQPNELVGLLNGFLSGMTRAIEAYGGFVDKFIGDAVMAVFGLSDVNADNNKQTVASDNAVTAALTMIEELKRYNRNLPDGLSPLKIGIGIHTGKVIAGLIGSPQKRSYTIIGDAVNTASRIEGMTKMLGADILISKEVSNKFTRDDIILRPLGRFCPKGRLCFVEVYEIMAVDDGSPKLNAVKTECEQAGNALNLFYQRDFSGAASILKTLIKQVLCIKRAHGYKLVLKEAERLMLKPQEDTWQGEVVLMEK